MKVLLLIDSLASGGAQRQLVILANELCKKHDVTLMTYYPLDFYQHQLDKRVNRLFVAKATNTLLRIPRIYAALKKNSPNVVISYLDTPSIIACACKLMGLQYKLIVSERNTTQHLSQKERIKFFLYRVADAIVPNSHIQTSFIEKHYPLYKSKLTTITNCADLRTFVPDYSKKKEHGVILCVGRITHQKNILRFIEAINMVRECGTTISVKWFGSRSDPAYFKKCKEKIEEYGLQQHFIFYNASKDIHKEYQQAEVFCLPSLYEGFPNVIGEAMCCGLPVLCSDVCDNSVLVKHEDNGLLFDPLNAESIRDSIVEFFNMKEEKKKDMGHRSRKRAEEILNKETFVKKYLNLIEE